jgi:hypothetical protein
MATSDRITITLPPGMAGEIDQYESNRSRFVADAVKREFRRRRRLALKQSLDAPHTEAEELAGLGFADWAAGLPIDDDLVDASAGTPVKWVGGKGWVKVRK